MYGKVLVYFLISELQAAATHTLCTVLGGGGRDVSISVFYHVHN